MENKMNLVVTINHQLTSTQSTVQWIIFLFWLNEERIEYKTLKGVLD